MKSEFEILISFRTPGGFKVCGQFFLGKSRELAEQVFEGLKGSKEETEKAMLHVDLIDNNGSLPERVRSIGCKLNQLTANCEHVTREIFRAQAIDGENIT